MTDIKDKLFSMQDLSYRDFHSKLMPTINKETIIGVRTPVLRSYAKELFKSGDYDEFLNQLPHEYYEENNLHGFLIEQIMDYDRCIMQIERFLPYIDNWATCDLLRPKVFKKNLPQLLEKTKVWIKSEQTYTVRFAIEMLMCYYSGKQYLEMVANVKSDEYYVNMMIAWYLATELSRNFDDAIVYIEQKKLSKWVHNKTIQKALESYRITDEQKQYLRKLKG